MHAQVRPSGLDCFGERSTQRRREHRPPAGCMRRPLPESQPAPEEAVARGRELSLDDAVALALGDAPAT